MKLMAFMRTRDHFQIDVLAPIPCLWGVAMPQHSKKEAVTVGQMAQGNQGATDQGWQQGMLSNMKSPSNSEATATPAAGIQSIQRWLACRFPQRVRNSDNQR